MNVFGFISNIFGPAAEVVDALHTSEEEKLKVKAVLLEVQTSFLGRVMDLERATLEAQAAVIQQEAKSESWVTRSWRPITMLSFVGATLAYWFGLTPEDLPPEAVENMFTLVQIGVGGYVVGRSAEKTVPAVLKSLKSAEQS